MLSQLSRDFAKWRTRAGQLVSARNRLLKLYNMFGPAVLFDPTWAVQDLVRGRSALFVPVWDKLYAYIREHQPKLPSVDRAQRVLYPIMDVLGGKTIAQHVDKFIRRFPPNPAALKDLAR
ncbi:hypothetical protein FOMPIDRAFT_1047181 [Fomitopsis schrenkii]|uniref:Uncharacterized protein n=1 Tax=Fomitopsis schrenkii TaxID=2126942 RepID=S8EIV3_FOMSC|nr:hypothetical protein FOMPIDRAFT_1047181 [Fomitopsis schrenkii]